MITQLALLPDLLADNEIEPRLAKPSVPVAKLIGGKWCWKAFDSDAYVHEPALEQILLPALAKQAQRRAA
jgi:hypothetical protein